jgi:ribosomal protein S18 acetylase RimI-like enzyme
VEVVRLERRRLGEASDMLAHAFQDDPAWVWLLPNAERRARLLPWLFQVGFEISSADVWTTPGRVVGAARWLPPGRQPMRTGAMVKALAVTPFRLRSAMVPFLSYGRAVEAMRVEVAPGPHWYLAGLGVEPAEQGHGIGGALLSPGIDAASASGLPAVLLTNNETNLPFYERHGFRVVREGSTPKNGPRAWAMVRRS